MTACLQGVSYATGGRLLLDNLNLRFEQGSRTLLLGPNGAGKSTLLRLLSGHLKPSRGEALLDGQAIASLPLARRSRRIAMLTQQASLAFPFTSKEVVAMGLLPHATSASLNTSLAQELLSQFSLPPERDYTTLSGGEKQLVQLARVLAQVWHQGGKSLLLLDEPTAPLDLKHQQLVFDVLDSLRQRGVTQVLVMHDVNLAAATTDQVALLAGGRLLAAGAPAQTLTEPNLSATFDVPIKALADSATGRRFFVAGLASGRQGAAD